ncbi:MAG: pseudaminic acid biosynthesis-associated methylase, partial [Nanoarchaeota archaeon]
YKEIFGITITDLNKEFISLLDKDSHILEVGCNIGKQLEIIEKMGFTNLWGIDINTNVLKIAKEKKEWNLVEGSAFDIPFKDNFFEMVFTSGVMIHIHPHDLDKIFDEMYRVTKKYIWCFEYFSENCQEIEYRGNKNKLWKNNFLQLFIKRHPDLKIVKEKKLKYLDSNNIDVMFMLEKNQMKLPIAANGGK